MKRNIKMKTKEELINEIEKLVDSNVIKQVDSFLENWEDAIKDKKRATLKLLNIKYVLEKTINMLYEVIEFNTNIIETNEENKEKYSL
ncbi:MAG: hypothetical protein LBT66_05825 [Methanobrevibacter sp.]|jgi:hypothetical protein|nr:hypothetical protein [Candidatus Methanovirga meridionalis]